MKFQNRVTSVHWAASTATALLVTLCAALTAESVWACTVAPHETKALELRDSASLLVGRVQEALDAHARLLENADPRGRSTSVVAEDLNVLDRRLFAAWSALDRNHLDWRVNQELSERSDLVDCVHTKYANYQLESPCTDQFAHYQRKTSIVASRTSELTQVMADVYHGALVANASPSMPTIQIRTNVRTVDLDQVGRQLAIAKSTNSRLVSALQEEGDARSRLYDCIQGRGASSSLLLLIDVSGSMQGSKLSSAKKAAIDTIRKAIKSETEIAVLAFEGDCNQPIRDLIGFSRNERELIAFVNGLTAKGGTPLATALDVTNRFMQQNKSAGSKTQMILLLADGHDDCGSLESVLSNLKKNNLLYRHETVGLEVDDAAKRQLENIAIQSGGKYHSATNANLSKVFSNAVDLMRMLDMLGKFK